MINTKLIYYFSGAGNSLYAATEIAKQIKPAKIISMGCDPMDFPAVDADVIGFVFPVYHWSMPGFVKSFIERLSINPGAYIFAVASCAGLPENALNDFNKIILAKGAMVSYSKVHNNVASYVAMYEPFPNPEKTLPKSAEELKIISDEISNKIYNEPWKKTLLKEIKRLVQIPFVRKLPTMDKGFCVSKDCNSCGLCSRVCSPKNIVMANGTPVFQHHCAQCMACVVFCPKKALNYKNKTQTRTKYHHPNVTAKMMTTESMEF